MVEWPGWHFDRPEIQLRTFSAFIALSISSQPRSLYFSFHRYVMVLPRGAVNCFGDIALKLPTIFISFPVISVYFSQKLEREHKYFARLFAAGAGDNTPPMRRHAPKSLISLRRQRRHRFQIALIFRHRQAPASTDYCICGPKRDEASTLGQLAT